MRNKIIVGLFCFVPLFVIGQVSYADTSAAENIEFDDAPLSQDIILPDWFKLSFLELRTDIAELAGQKKQGLIVYFGRKDCPYCKALLDKDWGDRGIETYTREHFDVVAIDVQGLRPVADVNGVLYRTEKEYAAKLKTHFTPSLLFYDREGTEVLRLVGYHPPYDFRAALEYVADGHYKKENFRKYMARGHFPSAYEESEMHSHRSFGHAPYALDRNHVAATEPLVVFFEEPTCHSCNVLHRGPLKDKVVNDYLDQLDVIQLDMHASTPVLTPQGERLTARKWAEKLGLYYAPTIIAFDETGKEILRVDSVIRFFRLRGVLEYIVSRGYKEYPTYQLWRQRAGLNNSR